MAAVIQVKRGSASSWTSANTVLAAGEIGFETDTKKMKVGDGSTAWTSLGYTATDGDISGVTAGTGLSGGGTSGAVTLNLSTPVATTNGGTGLSSFTTGDLVYASGSNTLAARSIGSTGQVLTVSGGVPAWSSPSSGSLVKINTTTLSSASTITISNIFTSTYDNYMITWSQSGASANYAGLWQLTSGGTATTTNYYSIVMVAEGSNTYAARSWTVIANPFYNDSFAPWYYTNGTPCPADAPAAVTYVFNPNKARTTTILSEGYGNNGVHNLQGVQTSNTQFDGFKWTPNGPTVSGTITVYGIEK